MSTKAGVWIDHKQAIIVLVTDAGKEIKKVAFDIGQPIRATGGSRSRNPYKPKEFVAEDTLERKLGNDRNNYYDDQKTPGRHCRTGNGRQNDDSSDCC